VEEFVAEVEIYPGCYLLETVLQTADFGRADVGERGDCVSV
jgi:hypothetical protein